MDRTRARGLAEPNGRRERESRHHPDGVIKTRLQAWRAFKKHIPLELSILLDHAYLRCPSFQCIGIVTTSMLQRRREAEDKDRPPLFSEFKSLRNGNGFTE